MVCLFIIQTCGPRDMSLILLVKTGVKGTGVSQKPPRFWAASETLWSETSSLFLPHRLNHSSLCRALLAAYQEPMSVAEICNSKIIIIYQKNNKQTHWCFLTLESGLRKIQEVFRNCVVEVFTECKSVVEMCLQSAVIFQWFTQARHACDLLSVLGAELISGSLVIHYLRLSECLGLMY